jgi:hypothetical protein
MAAKPIGEFRLHLVRITCLKYTELDEKEYPSEEIQALWAFYGDRDILDEEEDI